MGLKEPSNCTGCCISFESSLYFHSHNSQYPNCTSW